MVRRSPLLLVPIIASLACGGDAAPGEPGGDSSTGVPSSTSSGPSDSQPGTSSSGGESSSSGEAGEGGGLCGSAPDGEACTPISWGYYFTYSIVAPDYGTLTASCAVFATSSGGIAGSRDRNAYDTGLACDFGSGLDQVFATRVVVPDGTRHPLRPGDRVTVDAQVNRFWGLGEFALRDEATGELVMGAHSGVGSDPSPDRFAPMRWEPTTTDCGYEPYPYFDECFIGAAPYSVQVSLGDASVSMTDGESASLGNLDVFINALRYFESNCVTCSDVASGHTAAVFGDGFFGPADDDCLLFAQNCPGDERCVPVSSGSGVWDATACVPSGALGDGNGCVPADPTTGIDDCAAGLLCVVDDEDPEGGLCRPTCGGSIDVPECSAAGDRCNLQPAGDTPPLVCVPRCVPLAGDCGEPEKACVHTEATGFVCANAGDDAPGEECEYANGCEAGLACLPGPFVDGCITGSCCAAFCSLSEPVCEQGICTPYLEESQEGYEDLGICITTPKE